MHQTNFPHLVYQIDHMWSTDMLICMHQVDFLYMMTANVCAVGRTLLVSCDQPHLRTSFLLALLLRHVILRAGAIKYPQVYARKQRQCCHNYHEDENARGDPGT